MSVPLWHFHDRQQNRGVFYQRANRARRYGHNIVYPVHEIGKSELLQDRMPAAATVIGRLRVALTIVVIEDEMFALIADDI